MEMEVTKVSNVMSELFRKCRRRAEQPVRDFNVEFERMMLRLKELDCELPSLVKAWLYLDKLKLTDAEELNLLSSVHNRYDVKLLQQAAILHDRGARRPWDKGARWKTGDAATRHVHMTDMMTTSRKRRTLGPSTMKMRPRRPSWSLRRWPRDTTVPIWFFRMPSPATGKLFAAEALTKEN